MHEAHIIDGLELKFNALAGDLDERGPRRWAATEAMALGYGGITTVALATGLSDRTIRTGIKELRSHDPFPSSRQRRVGGGRKPLEDSQTNLIAAIDRLVEPTERGDPQSPLRWTCKSLTNLQRTRLCGRTNEGLQSSSFAWILFARQSQNSRRHRPSRSQRPV